MLAYIPFIYFTLSLIIHLANPKKRFGAGAMSLLWIDISAFFSILLDSKNLYGQFGCNEYAISFTGVLLYCLLWTIILVPILKLDHKDITLEKQLRKPGLFKFVCIFIIICMSIRLLTTDYLAILKEILQSDSSDIYASKLEKDVYSGGANLFWLWIPNIVSSFTVLYLLCWWISITICQQSKLISTCLLLFSSFAMLLEFATGGRAQLIWWIAMFLILYFLFKSALSHKQNKYILVVFSCFFTIVFTGFIIITLSRFDDGASNAIDSLIGYSGQQLNNFCAILPYVDIAHLYPDRVFPLCQYIINKQPYDMLEYYSFLHDVYPIRMNVFFTLFGSLLIDTGILGLLIFLLLYYVLTAKLNSSNDVINSSSLFMWGLLFCIPVRGLFGWPYTNFSNTLYIWFSIALFILFHYNIKSGNKKIV